MIWGKAYPTYYKRGITGFYGLTEEELRCILDGEDFPSETFRILKEKETRLYAT